MVTNRTRHPEDGLNRPFLAFLRHFHLRLWVIVRPDARVASGMVVPMCAFADRERSIDPRIIGLLRRSLMIAGLLFGFLVAGNALAHADGHPSPPPKPSLGIGLPGLPTPPIVKTITKTVTKTVSKATKPVTTSVEPILQPIISVAAHTVGTVTQTLAPVTKTLTGLTTTVVQTIAPIIEPAVAVTTPILQPVMPVLPPPPPGRSPGGGTGTTTTPDRPNPAPATALPATDPLAVPPSVTIGSTQAAVVVPPANAVTFDGILVLPVHVDSDEAPLVPTQPPMTPPGNDGGPLADVTGASSGGVSGPSGPVSGISRPPFGTATDLLSATRVRPGTGAPKWWFFDPHHHPS